MSFLVMEPSQLPKERDLTYLIANRGCFDEIRAQLLSYGIQPEQIMLAPFVSRDMGTGLIEDNDVLPR